MFGLRAIISRNSKNVMTVEDAMGRCFMLPNGRIAVVGGDPYGADNVLSDPDTETEDFFAEIADVASRIGIPPSELYQDNGDCIELKMGVAFVDQYKAFGTEPEQGSSFLYYDGETFDNFCRRNGIPCPTAELPDELIEILTENDEKGFIRMRGYCDKLAGFPMSNRFNENRGW